MPRMRSWHLGLERTSGGWAFCPRSQKAERARLISPSHSKLSARGVNNVCGAGWVMFSGFWDVLLKKTSAGGGISSK
jgi:hypothetical protein